MSSTRLWLKLGAAFGLALLAPPALAESSADFEDPVPSAEPPAFSESWIRADRTAMVTIITREQIEAQRTASITEVLRMIPGLHVTESGARGGVTSLHMRGGEANYTAVLIDGVRVNDPTNSRGGSFDFALLGTENIERIEIMHGPLSAGWSSSAISGAINIVTRRGETDGRTTLDVSADNDGYHRGLLELNGRDGRLDYSLSFSLGDIGDPMPGSEFKREALTANAGYELSDRVRLRGHFRLSDIEREAFSDASGGPRFAPAREVETRDTRFTLAGIGIEYDPTSWWRSRLDLAVFDQDEDLTTPPLIDPRGINTNLPPTTSDAEFTRSEITWRNHLALSDSVSLIAGAETSFERGSSDGLIDFFGFALIPTHFSLNRDVLAPFVEVEAAPLPGLRLRAGLRYEMPGQADNELTPHVGLLYTADSLDTVFRAN